VLTGVSFQDGAAVGAGIGGAVQPTVGGQSYGLGVTGQIGTARRHDDRNHRRERARRDGSGFGQQRRCLVADVAGADHPAGPVQDGGRIGGRVHQVGHRLGEDLRLRPTALATGREQQLGGPAEHRAQGVRGPQPGADERRMAGQQAERRAAVVQHDARLRVADAGAEGLVDALDQGDGQPGGVHGGDRDGVPGGPEGRLGRSRTGERSRAQQSVQVDGRGAERVTQQQVPCCRGVLAAGGQHAGALRLGQLRRRGGGLQYGQQARPLARRRRGPPASSGHVQRQRLSVLRLMGREIARGERTPGPAQAVRQRLGDRAPVEGRRIVGQCPQYGGQLGLGERVALVERCAVGAGQQGGESGVRGDLRGPLTDGARQTGRYGGPVLGQFGGVPQRGGQGAGCAVGFGERGPARHHTGHGHRLRTLRGHPPVGGAQRFDVYGLCGGPAEITARTEPPGACTRAIKSPPREHWWG
jgi:hypothetical protein